MMGSAGRGGRDFDASIVGGNGGFGESDSIIEVASMVCSKRNDSFAVGNVRTAYLAKKDRQAKGSKNSNDNVEKSIVEVGVKYEVGGLVWAKMKSYPWWPSQIFNEAWATPSVCKTKKEGHVLVKFFGDGSYGWCDPKELVPFDTHYVEKSKKTKTTAFLAAVEEAGIEVSRRSALGLACPCGNLLNLRPINLFDWFYSVDIKGYETSGVYSMKQIRNARDSFQPVVTLSFMRQMALMPDRKLQRDVDWIKNVAMVSAYRKAVFEVSDETHVPPVSEAQLEDLGDSTVDFDVQEEVAFEVHSSWSTEISEAVGQTKKVESSVNITDQPKRNTCIFKQNMIHSGDRKKCMYIK